MAATSETGRKATERTTDRSAIMFARLFALLKHSASIFMAAKAPSRGAAIAFYTITSIAPVVLIVIAIAGLVFGDEAARVGAQ